MTILVILFLVGVATFIYGLYIEFIEENTLGKFIEASINGELFYVIDFYTIDKSYNDKYKSKNTIGEK
jgi:hypothetical protein